MFTFGSSKEKKEEALPSYMTNVTLVQSAALPYLFAKIRSEETSPQEFAFYADRLMRILAEDGIAQLAPKEVVVKTPTGDTYTGSAVDVASMCAVSIVRAGDSLLGAVRSCEPGISVGKILIQRDESTEDKRPVIYYSKLPPSIAEKDVLLVDPMLATGGSAKMAIKNLVESGVSPTRIMFLNVVACPEGLHALLEAYPDVRVVTAAVDEKLDGEKYICPGLGDYGDRYFGTC